MQTKNAIGNLVNRYRAVLKKCNLLNTFGSLAMASAIAMSGVSLANAAAIEFKPDKEGIVESSALDDTNGNTLVSKDGDVTVSINKGNGLTKDPSTLEVHASDKGNATLNINTDLKVKNGTLTLEGKDAADKAGKAAMINIANGSTVTLGNNGNNTIDGVAGGKVANQIVNVSGALKADNNGTAAELKLGNTSGVTVNVKETGLLSAGKLELDNTSVLNADIINISDTLAATSGVDVKELAITDGNVTSKNITVGKAGVLTHEEGKFTAQDLTIKDKAGNVAISNSDDAVANIGALTVENNSIGASTLSLVGDNATTNIGILKTDKKITHGAGTLAIGAVSQEGKAALTVEGGNYISGTLNSDGKTYTYTDLTLAKDGNGAGVFLNPILKADAKVEAANLNVTALTGYKATGNNATFKVNSLEVNKNFDADATEKNVFFTIRSQEGGNEDFLKGGNLTLTSNAGNAKLTLGTEPKDTANYSTTNSIILAGNVANNLTITADGGNWTVGGIEVTTDKKGTITAKSGTLTTEKLSLVGANSALTIDGILTVSGTGADALSVASTGAGNGVTITANSTLIKQGELSINAAEIADKDKKINLGDPNSKLVVDNLTFTDGNLGGIKGSIEANSIKADKGFTVASGTIVLGRQSAEADAYSGKNLVVTGNNAGNTKGNLRLAGNGGVINSTLEVKADNGTGGIVIVESPDWTVKNLDVQANGSVTVGTGNSAASLNVTDSLKNAQANTGLQVKNLAILQTNVEALGLKYENSNYSSNLGANTVALNAGGTLKVDGLGEVADLNKLKSALVGADSKGLLDITGADLTQIKDLHTQSGNLNYDKVAGLTSDEFKSKTAEMKGATAQSGLSGGFADIHITDKQDNFAVKGTSQLTGANGKLATANGIETPLKANVQDNSALILGDMGKKGSGALDKVTLQGANSTLSAINGNFTVNGIAGSSANGTVTVSDGATLTSKGEVNVKEMNIGSNFVAEGANITTDTLDLVGGKVSATQKVGQDGNPVKDTGDITIGTISGVGEVAGNNVTVTNKVANIDPAKTLFAEINAKTKATLTGGVDLTKSGDGLLVTAKDIEVGAEVKNAENTSLAMKADNTINFKGAVTTDTAIFEANTFTADDTVSLNGGALVAKGVSTDPKKPAENTFTKAFTAKNGAMVALGGQTTFGEKVIVGAGTDKEAANVVVDYVKEAHADGFEVAGSKIDSKVTNSYLEVKNFADNKANAAFNVKEYGHASIGSMTQEQMQKELEVAQKVSGQTYNSVLAISELNDSKGKHVAFDLAGGIAIGGTGSVTTNALTINKNGLLIADVTGLNAGDVDAKGKITLHKEQEALAKGTGGLVVTGEGAGIHLAGAKADKAYTLVSGGKITNANNDELKYTTDNRLVNFKEVQDHTSGVLAVTTLNDAKKIFPLMDPSLAGILNNYAHAGENAFLHSALNTTNGLSNAEVANTIEGAAKAAAISGAPQQAISIATGSADLVMSRVSFAPRVAGAASVNENGEYNNISAGDNMSNGANLWIMPMYQNQSADGFKSGNYTTGFDSDFGGVVLGGDYTWDNSFRLGATVNMGTGSADSTGSFAKTENDFDSVGFGLYAGYMFGNIGLSADVNYTNVSNDITQNTRVGLLEGDFDTNVYSGGVRAEYKLQAGGMDIIPHLGVRFSHIEMDNLDMRMGGATVLSGHSAEADILQFPIGVTLSKDFVTEGGWNIKPSLDLSIIPVAGDKELAQDVSFAGVNGIASMESEIMDSVSGRAQIGIEMSKDNYYMGLDYAYQGSSNMDSHGIQANFGFRF